MKTLIVVINLIFVCTLCSAQINCEILPNWNVEVNEPPIIQKQHDIFFPSESVGYTVGVGGTMRKTTNGGKAWEILHSYEESGTRAILRSVYFLDDEIGFTAGDGEDNWLGNIHTDAVFMKTTDGGLTWEKQIIDGIDWIGDILFFTESNGLALFFTNDENYILVETNNGGLTWTEIDLPIKHIFKLKFILAGEDIKLDCIDSNNERVLFTSANNGVDWGVQPFPNPVIDFFIYNIHFINESIGFVNSGHKTFDGGQTWQVDNHPLEWNSLIHFKSENEGFIINEVIEYDSSQLEPVPTLLGINIFQTFDGGISWEKSEAGIECNLVGLFHSPDNEHLATYGVMDGSFECSSSTASTTIFTNEEISIFPNPASDKIMLELEEMEFSISIFNSSGQKVVSKLNQKEIDVSLLPSGTYILEIKSYTHESRLHKLIIR